MGIHYDHQRTQEDGQQPEGEQEPLAQTFTPPKEPAHRPPSQPPHGTRERRFLVALRRVSASPSLRRMMGVRPGAALHRLLR